MLANGESAHQVDDTAAQLPAQTPILALIESALGGQRAFDIASAASTPRLAFGSGDFRRDTGASDDATALAYARARLVVARRPAGAHRRTHGVRSRRAPRHRLGRHAMGLTGKLCMRPEHVKTVNRELSPAAPDIAWAVEVIAELGSDGSRVKDAVISPHWLRPMKFGGWLRFSPAPGESTISPIARPTLGVTTGFG